MNKRLFASLVLTSLSTAAHAYDINGFTLSGDERAGWVSYDYGNPDGLSTINKGHKDSDGFYVMPKLSLQTPEFSNFNAKITVAGATDFGINDEGKQSRNFVFDPTENESFAILQELYLEYDFEDHNALIGRNEIVTPMIDFDDWYMLGNSFELAKYTNTSLEHHRFHVGYFNKMAGVWDSGANGTEFHYMSTASFTTEESKANAGDAGVYFAAVEYNGDKHHGQVWEYYAEDLYNTFFAQYNYKSGSSKYKYDFGLQFINWSQVGALKDNAGKPLASEPTKIGEEINYSLTSIKYDGSMDNGFSFATGYSKYSDGEGTGATLGAWGGYPYFANGMIFHFFEAGNLRNASSYKVQGAYDLTKVGFNNAALSIRYTFFDLDSDYSFASNGIAQDA
ncbi:MAG: hypothetical protein IMF17_06785, partial [Proteobacteria bacterium]|nr:hypothetical protein [Pseudomonadota bacterium]